MFAQHPETQLMFPKFANVPQSQLMANKDFLQQAYTCLAGLNFMVKNMDDEDLVIKLLSRMASPAFYVDFSTPGQQLDASPHYYNLKLSEQPTQLK